MQISVVVPVYQCAGCLTELYKRLKDVLDKVTDKYEIIFVDDRARDNSWDVITKLAQLDQSIRAVRLSRNFGQQIAITAGLAESRGDWVVVMDCDLQDPPEKIIELYEIALSGYDIVFAKRKQKKHNLVRRFCSSLYFKIVSKLSNTEINNELGAFSIISRKVVNAFLQFNDIKRHYTFILYWLGFNVGYIEYLHEERYSGKSSYSLSSLLKHALGGVLFQTTTLLKWIMYLGFLLSLAGTILACYYIAHYFFYSVSPGWTTIIVMLLIIGGIITSSIGVVGLYIAGIFEQTKGRPLFVIDKKIQ